MKDIEDDAYMLGRFDYGGGILGIYARSHIHADYSEKKPFVVPVPQSVLPINHEFSPMGVESPMVLIRKLMTRRRDDVVDIDVIKDPLACSEYAQDVIDYLQAVEQRYTIPKNFLTLESDIVKPHMRTMVVDWLIKVQVARSLSQHTLHLCVHLLDKFLTLQRVEKNVLQLVGIGCLLLASKYHDISPPEIQDLCNITNGTYEPYQVLVTEEFILKNLNFDLNLPEQVTFLERFLMVHECEQKSLIQSMSMYLVDLTLTEIQFVYYYPSMIAASAIYVSIQLLGFYLSWDSSFVHYTKYSEKELFECAQAMKRCLVNLSKRKYTSATVKYAHDKYDSISSHEVLSAIDTQLWPELQDDDDTDII